MTIDKPRHKSEITQDILKREKDKKKRLKDTEKVVKDKKIEADTARALRLSGTQEGSEAIKKAMEAAEKITNQEFEKQEREIKKEVFKPAEELEKDLGKRSDATKNDMKKLSQASVQIDTKSSIGLIKEAENGAKKDAQFLDKSLDKQKKDRTEGEKTIEEQKKKLKGARVTFKK